MIVVSTETRERWRVVFEDPGYWRCGLYVPEFTSLSEVDYMEKHDAPELFLLLEGKVVLVLSEDGAELREVPMERGKLYVVTEWHNAYRPGNCRGVALVVERTGISTTYKKLK